MLGRDRRQATLLERYWARLRRDRRAVPPSGLDPEIADLAVRLERNLAAPAPTSAYAETMRRRLATQAERLAAGEAPELPARPEGPTRPDGPRPMTPTQRQPRETQPMRPALDDHPEIESSPDAPPPLQQPRSPWYREYGKLAAAIAVIAIVGIVLALVLRDDDEATAGRPLPVATSTALATATVAPTPPLPSPTIPAVAPTQPAPEASAVGTAFHVSVPNFVVPDGVSYLDIERASWAAFDGSDENAANTSAGLVYQDIGTESCWVSRPEAPVYRADGSTEASISSDLGTLTQINAGDAYTLPAGIGYNCRNNTATRTVNLSGGLLPAAPPEPSGGPSGLDYQIVAGAEAPDLPSGPATVTLERVLVDPGAEIPGGGPAWRLVWAEHGALTVQAGGETRALAEGESTLVSGDAALSYRNDGDTVATAIIFTVVPEQASSAAQPFSISARLDALGEGSNYISLEWTTWRQFGGTDENAVATGPTLSYQDTGAWDCFSPSGTITVVRADGSTEPMSRDLSARSSIPTGDGFMMPASSGYNCINSTQGDATEIELVVYRGGITGFNPTLPGGMTFEVLASGPVAELPAGPVTFTIERVIVAPGESLPSLNGVAATVFVESGAATLSGTAGGETLMHEFTESTEQLPAGVEAQLAANDGLTLPVNNAATIVNSGEEPLVVIIATIVPAG